MTAPCWLRGLTATAALLATSACGITATAKPTGATVPSSVATDPYAVPPTITKAYVNRVMNRLDEIQFPAIRSMATHERATRQARNILDEVLTPSQLTAQFQLASQLLSHHAFGVLRHSPRPATDTVMALYRSSTSCIVFLTSRNTDPTFKSGRSFLAYVVLWNYPPTAINNTPWRINYFATTKPEISKSC